MGVAGSISTPTSSVAHGVGGDLSSATNSSASGLGQTRRKQLVYICGHPVASQQLANLIVRLQVRSRTTVARLTPPG